MDDLIARLRQVLAPLPALIGAGSALKPAAVLVPIVVREEAHLLFTQRAEHLSRHAGQVSFPGGRIDPTDASPLDAALRECEEEIGLDRRHITPLGALDLREIGTGYLVAPIVGLVTPPFTLTPDPREVAGVFEVPLRFVMDRANHTTGITNWKGRDWQYVAIPFGDRKIWGATASMIVNLCERLERAGAPA